MILRTLFDVPGSSLYNINSLVIESRLPYLVQKQFHTNQEQWVLSIVPAESLLIVFLIHLSGWKLELTLHCRRKQRKRTNRLLICYFMDYFPLQQLIKS